MTNRSDRFRTVCLIHESCSHDLVPTRPGGFCWNTASGIAKRDPRPDRIALSIGTVLE